MTEKRKNKKEEKNDQAGTQARSDCADINMYIAVSCLHCLDATICMYFQLTICEQQIRIILYLRSLISPLLFAAEIPLPFINCFVSSGSQAGVYLCILGIFNRNIWNANSNGSGQNCDVQSRQDICRSLKLKMCPKNLMTSQKIIS